MCAMLLFTVLGHFMFTKGLVAAYLWFRIPLQLFFIAWIGYFSL